MRVGKLMKRKGLMVAWYDDAVRRLKLRKRMDDDDDDAKRKKKKSMFFLHYSPHQTSFRHDIWSLPVPLFFTCRFTELTPPNLCRKVNGSPLAALLAGPTSASLSIQFPNRVHFCPKHSPSR